MTEARKTEHRSAARGHKKIEGVPSESQKQRARDEAFIVRTVDAKTAQFHDRDVPEPGRHRELVDAAIRDLVRRRGMAHLRRFVAWSDALNAEYRANGHKALGLNLDELAEEWEVPPFVAGYH
jgi:hypothetical protein